MAEFKTGDRVKVVKPGAKTLGRVGTVKAEPTYKVLLDDEATVRPYAESSLKLVPPPPPPAPAPASDPPPQGWKLVKSWDFATDQRGEFNVQNGPPTSGNNVGGIYKASNVRWSPGELLLVGDGVNGSNVNTRGFSRTYGRWEVRARMDAGSGAAPCLVLWPVSQNWPVDGEIDFMESPYGDHVMVQVTTHWGANNLQDHVTRNADAKQWHQYAVEWEQGVIRYFIDDQLVREFKGIPGREIPNKPMVCCLQVDGPNGWVPRRDANSPAEMAFHVDYVKIYSR